MPRKTNIRINDSDYYRVTATVGINADGQPIRKQFYGESKKDAEAKRDEYLINIKKGLPTSFDKITFNSVFKTWLETVLKPSVSLASYNKYETDYRLRIQSGVLSKMKLVDIKSIHVQSFYNDLLNKFTVNTVRQTHSLIHNFFKYCLKSDLILKDPLLAVELPVLKSTSETNRALTDREIEKLLSAAKNEPKYFIFAFALFSGLRQGEILALTFRDIDFINNVIRVNKSVKYLTVNGEYKAVLSHTKTSHSVRDIPILEAIQTPLREHMRREIEKYRMLSITHTEHSLLFSSYAATYREGGNLRISLKRLCKRLKMPPVTFHSLRHSFCTILAKQGVPLKTASMLMGHASIAVTARVYTHVDNVELKKGIEKLSAYYI